MSKIDDMIAKLCPNGVEYKALGDVSKINRGVRVTRDMLATDGKIPVYQNALTPLGYFDKSNRKAYSVYLIGAGAAGKIGFSDIEFWAADDCYTFDDLNQVNDKFLYYFLQTQQNYIDTRVRKGSIPRISRDVFEKIKIPVPPLKIQEEIVHILDKFTSLTAELTAELTARRKQYEFYRDQLLSFTNVRGGLTFDNRPENVKWMPLGQCCNMKAGKAISASNIYNEPTRDVSIPCYGGNGLRGYVAQENQNGNFCLIGRQGALCGNVCFATGKFYATEHAVVVKNNSSLKSRFLFHLLTNMNLNQYKSQGAQPGLAVGKLEEIKIPVPSLEIQEKIVHVLDNFDAVCNDLKIGLPAEIEARKKQYEYYRDRLLAFTPPR